MYWDGFAEAEDKDLITSSRVDLPSSPPPFSPLGKRGSQFSWPLSRPGRGVGVRAVLPLSHPLQSLAPLPSWERGWGEGSFTPKSPAPILGPSPVLGKGLG
jgi:hypothetical protein